MSKAWTHLQASPCPRQLHLTAPQGRISGNSCLYSQKETINLPLVTITQSSQQVHGQVVQLTDGQTAIWSSLGAVLSEATLLQKNTTGLDDPSLIPGVHMAGGAN